MRLVPVTRCCTRHQALYCTVLYCYRHQAPRETDNKAILPPARNTLHFALYTPQYCPLCNVSGCAKLGQKKHPSST